jgi:hypothetical protein
MSRFVPAGIVSGSLPETTAAAKQADDISTSRIGILSIMSFLHRVTTGCEE